MKRHGRDLLVTALVLVAVLAAQHAAANPFGVARPDGAVGVSSGPLAGVFGWIAVKQAEFYRALSGLISAFRTDPAAGWALIGLSFLYGLFHAAGPGHGKVVITSYMVATGQTMRRGVMLSFASAFVQALSAIAIVAVLTIALRATSTAMNRVTGIVEIASYALIALIGVRLVWVKGSALAARMPAIVPFRTAAAGMPGDGHVHHDHPHGAGNPHGHNHGHHHGHHHHHHGDDCGCGHSHGPDPASLAGPMSLGRAWTAVLAVGLRPCSGALIVLVFAFSQGIFGIGIASTLAMAVGTGLAVAILACLAVGARGLAARLADGDSAAGAWAATGLQVAELLAALAVLLFGLLLLGGALSAGI